MTLLLCAAAALQIAGHPARAWATSELQGKGRYAAKNAFDGDPATAWVEGAKGLGEGETLFLELEKPARVAGFVLIAGYARSPETLVQNAAPRKVEIAADGAKILDLEIPWVEARPEDGDRCLRTSAPLNLAPRLVMLPRPLLVKKLALRLVQVSAGTRFEDTAISEWRPIFEGAPLAPPLEQARAVLASLREGKPLLAPDARADAILPWGRGQQGADYPDYDAFIAVRLDGAQLPPAEAFLHALGQDFLGRAVLVQDRRLLGGMSFTHGDGEWDELYPELVLDGQGRIAELRRAFHNDGAPGCRRALPPAL